MEVAKRYQDQLDRIKRNVRSSHDYFKENYDRYNEFRKFVFDSSLSDADIQLLATMGRPQIEFNICEAYISRLLGEFSKQQPDIEVSADDMNSADPKTIALVDQHMRHVFNDEDASSVRYEVYKEVLSGGFSVIKVETDYANSMRMHQIIKIRKSCDPTLCGFDILAKEPHKGDGDFCFENYPMSLDRFEKEYPDVDTRDLSFKRGFEGFNWSYINDKDKILIVCEYYEKKHKDMKIVQLRDGKVIPLKDYEEMVDGWDQFEPPPAIIGKPRWTTIDTICRYRLIENKIIDYIETDFNHLPLIFVDGNSVILKNSKNGNVRQFTRPCIYHLKGAQKTKNYAGITWANDMENMVQHKFIVKKEALPKEEDWLDALKNPQKPSTIVVNAFYDENPEMIIPDPISPVPRVPLPPEVPGAFQAMDQFSQISMGSYDAALGINNNQLSGKAISLATTNSNATAMPFIVGVMAGLTRAAQIYVDLIPKYYTTSRTLPIMDKKGKRDFIAINQQEQPGAQQQQNSQTLDYDSNALNVVVKAGASFTAQKSHTLMLVKEIMGMSPLFAQFISEKGLDFVLDNMEGRGIEQLKSMVDQWLQEMQQQKQMAMQMQQQEMQNNPNVIKAQIETQKMQMKGAENQQKFAADMAKLKLDEAKIVADLQTSREANKVQLVKAETEHFAKQVDLAIKGHDTLHKHKMDIHDRTHPEGNNNA